MRDAIDKDAIEKSAAGNPPLPAESMTYGEIDVQADAATMAVADHARNTDRTRVTSPFRDAVRRFTKNRAALVSLAIVVILILAAIFAPFLRTTNPVSIDFNALDVGPTAQHWFGTDPEGRDEYSRILYGMRIPFIIGFVGTFVTLVVGLGLGLLAGYYGGWIDALTSRFTDFMFAFPGFLFAIIIVSLFGGAFDAAFPNGVGRAIILIVVFAFVSWPPLMRFVRSLALSLREQQFVEAARTVGTTNTKIILRHLVPNVWGLVLVQASFLIASIIGTEAVLSIIGLGVNQPTPDLGSMLYDGSQHMDVNGWEAFFPSLFLTVLILTFTFMGDGIRDAVDPRGKE